MKLLFENWRKFIKESEDDSKSSAALKYLEDAFKDTHVSGRPFTKLFDELNEEELPNEVLEMVNNITPEYIAEILQKYKSVGFRGSINMDDVSDPREIAIINSIMLFTAGNVATIRNPEKFSPEEAEELSSPIPTGYKNAPIAAVPKYYRGEITKAEMGIGAGMGPEEFEYAVNQYGIPGYALPYVIKPTKVLYAIARDVMLKIANMNNPEGSTHIYRGISLPPDIGIALKAGMEFNPGAIASWSTVQEIAARFSYPSGMMSPEEHEALSPEEKQAIQDAVAFLFNIKSSEVGASIASLSTFKGEFEYILGRKVKIIDIEYEYHRDYYSDEVSDKIIGATIICDEI